MTERTVFFNALDIADPAERAAYLDQACSGDEALRRQVVSLMAAHEREGAFLNAPVAQLADALGLDLTDGPVSDQINETQTEPAQTKRERDVLALLAPSHEPGSLGRLDHYEVLAVVGSGGMGVVLKARDTSLQRVVAIKLLAPQWAASGAARKRFVREAQAAAAVRNDHIVSIHAVQGTGPIPYLVMEYIEGVTLDERIKQRGPLELKEILRIGLQIAAGLAAAHKHGLVHRDVKPANILLENGVERVKITDFGLARAVDDASLTQSGVIAGTPMYMSPEQAEGRQVDQRSDLFSLGSVLYAMCAGHAPFRAPTTMAVLKRVCEDSPRLIREVNKEIPEWLSDIIAQLHAKRPEDRFQSAKEAAELLGGGLAQLQQPPVAARSPTVAARSPDRATGRPRRWVLAAAVLVFLVGVLGATEATGVTKVAATVIRILTPDGTLVVEVDDPGVSVTIDGEDMVITGAGVKEIRLKPGQYKVLARKDGKVVSQELVTVVRNGREVVRVSKESDASTAGPMDERDPDRRAAEYVTSIGGLIQINDIDRDIRTVSQLPQEAFQLTRVKLLGNPQVSDAGLANFRGCKNLSEIIMVRVPMSDAGAENFKDCKSLTHLELSGDPLSDAGLAYFNACDKLTFLDLGHTHVSDAGLARFKNCKNLMFLNLSSTSVSDAGLRNFQDCKLLKLLWVERTSVSDMGLAYFKDCKNLTELALPGTKMSDAGLAYFKDCKHLTYLLLSNTELSDAGLESLKDCKDLTYLFLVNTKVTATGVNSLQKTLPQCKIEWSGGVSESKESLDADRQAAEYVLSIGGMVQINEASRDLQAISDLPKGAFWLTTISLRNNPQVSDAGLANFKECKNLTTLELIGPEITDLVLAHFKDCKALTTLALSGTKVSDAGLAVFKDCKNLTNLNLNETEVSDAGLAHLKDYKSLKNLYLHRTRVSDAALGSFKDCKNLMRLSLNDTQVSDAGLVFLKDCQNLTFLDLRNTKAAAAMIDDLKKALPQCRIDWTGGKN
jgi:eukaryotic-like serine/threonine-protein kinase